MSVLTLRLAGPLQSWGSHSRFVRRATESAPTKSGIIGLLAAAQGRRRVDEIEDLVGLDLAVRIDQQGTILRDFHTAHHPVTGESMPLTTRYYWSDAVFTAYLRGASGLVAGLADALANPAFPLFLGRRACVPSGPLVLAHEEDNDIGRLVGETSWQASRHHRRGIRTPMVTLPVVADASVFPGLLARRELHDIPVSFDPRHRQYRTRPVVDTSVDVPHPERASSDPHDPMHVAQEASCS